MFINHLHSHKHKQSLVTKQNIKAKLAKGNIKAQITTAIKNFSVERKERNQRFVKKFIKTIYFMGRNKWAEKNKFESLMNQIRDLGDKDF